MPVLPPAPGADDANCCQTLHVPREPRSVASVSMASRCGESAAQYTCSIRSTGKEALLTSEASELEANLGLSGRSK